MIKNRIRTLAPSRDTARIEAEFATMIRERVQRGAQLLDEKIPDWFERVDPDTLRMYHFNHWMAAQVTGSDFCRGTDQLGLQSLWSTIVYGFHHDREKAEPGTAVYHYIIAQDNWLNEVEKRLCTAPCKYTKILPSEEEE